MLNIDHERTMLLRKWGSKSYNEKEKKKKKKKNKRTKTQGNTFRNRVREKMFQAAFDKSHSHSSWNDKKRKTKCSTLKNIIVSRNAGAVSDAMLGKQVEVLKGNSSPPCPKTVMQEYSVSSATHLYMFTCK